MFQGGQVREPPSLLHLLDLRREQNHQVCEPWQPILLQAVSEPLHLLGPRTQAIAPQQTPSILLGHSLWMPTPLLKHLDPEREVSVSIFSLYVPGISHRQPPLSPKNHVQNNQDV
jgi:hypothetical protein